MSVSYAHPLSVLLSLLAASKEISILGLTKYARTAKLAKIPTTNINMIS